MSSFWIEDSVRCIRLAKSKSNFRYIATIGNVHFESTCDNSTYKIEQGNITYIGKAKTKNDFVKLLYKNLPNGLAMCSAFFKLRNNLIKIRNDEYRTEL